MQTYLIPKRSGGTRQIFAPDPTEKAKLREYLDSLNRAQSTLSAAHGFRPAHNVVTAARPHIGMAVTINMDLSDFFDSCTLDMAQTRGVPRQVLDEPLAFLSTYPDPLFNKPTLAAARQGLPTSPAIANLCAKPLDEAIVRLLTKAGYMVCTSGVPSMEHTAAYTRYADDLSVSFRIDPGQAALTAVRERIVDAAVRCGFRVNARKTHIRRAAGGRREVVGVMVDDTLHASRTVRRKLRAAEHQAARNSVCSLRAYCAMRAPLTAQETAERIAARQARDAARVWTEARAIATRMRVGCIEPAWGEAKTLKNEPLEYGARISVDPRDILCMGNVNYPGSSTYSCLRAGGAYMHSVRWWLACPGIGIAVLGKRNHWKARTIVYHMRDDTRWYGRVYGRMTQDCELLRAALHKAEIHSITQTSAHHIVHGNVSADISPPFLDFGSLTNVTANGEQKRRLQFGPR